MNIVKKILLLGVASVCVACSSTKSQTAKTSASATTLKDAFANKFYIGTALNLNQIWERTDKANDVVETHFNSIVAENCMKSENLRKVFLTSKMRINLWNTAKSMECILSDTH